MTRRAWEKAVAANKEYQDDLRAKINKIKAKNEASGHSTSAKTASSHDHNDEEH
jgi:hypothetical protein